MTIIDPTTDLGRLRLALGDWQDLPILPDSVILQTLVDSSGNLNRAKITLAQYILASLTRDVHQKLAQIEVYGEQGFDNYKEFIRLTILNPNLSQLAPIPYAGGLAVQNPLTKFTDDWNKNYPRGTQSQLLSDQAFGMTLI